MPLRIWKAPVLDTATLQAIGAGYVPLMVFACLLAGMVAIRDTKRRRGRFSHGWARFALLRSAVAIAAIHVAQHWIGQETQATLTWWQNLPLDLAAFIMATAPPRTWQQSMIGACFGTMVFMDVCWGIAGPSFGPFHYLISTMAGYTAFATLIIWTTGVPPRVQDSADRLRRWASQLVLAPLAKISARKRAH